MTLDEKIVMIEGAAEVAADRQYQAGYITGIPRLGIPSLKLTDGPPGVITRQDSTGMTSTMGVASTFSVADALANGVTIGRDARSLGQDLVLEPYVNIQRDTAFGRAFNTFGEDAFLTAQMGSAEIRGIQSQDVMAQVKHYVGYEGPNNVVVDARTLHEIYLQPFEAAINSGVSSVMCSYNKINGPYSCGNAQTLIAILRNELGFDGFVTSDWGATHSTTYLNAGLDMEMPGGGGPSGLSIPKYFSADNLKAALAAGTVKIARINEAVGRVLGQMDKFGLLDGNSKHDITPLDTAADQKVVLQTALHSAVLLKNDGILPLSNKSLSNLALIGPGAGQTPRDQLRRRGCRRSDRPADQPARGDAEVRQGRQDQLRRGRRPDRHGRAGVGAVA